MMEKLIHIYNPRADQAYCGVAMAPSSEGRLPVTLDDEDFCASCVDLWCEKIDLINDQTFDHSIDD